VTCILVRVRPKDVVHSRLYRPFSLKRKKKTRERGTNRRERWKNPEEREREGGRRRRREVRRYVLFNGVGVSARVEE